MANRSNRITFLFIVLFALVGGCALVPEPENDVDPRLDQLVSKVDQSLANQEMVNAQLQEQRRQLDLQLQDLPSSSNDLPLQMRKFLDL